jgi:hypothetical protein
MDIELLAFFFCTVPIKRLYKETCLVMHPYVRYIYYVVHDVDLYALEQRMRQHFTFCLLRRRGYYDRITTHVDQRINTRGWAYHEYSYGKNVTYIAR